MRLKEFIAAIPKGKWQLRSFGILRNEADACPITAVAGAAPAEDFRESAAKIGLWPHFARVICMTADRVKNPNMHVNSKVCHAQENVIALRRLLLAKCGCREDETVAREFYTP